MKLFGLEHYRRIFLNVSARTPVLESEVKTYLSKYDVILPYENQDKNRKNLYDDLASHITHKGVEYVLSIIHDLYGRDEEIYYRNWLNLIRKSGFNLFITHYDKFEKYAKWIFSILFELEKRATVLPNRSYGYISEFLMNAFWMRQQYSIMHLPILFCDNKRFMVNTPDML